MSKLYKFLRSIALIIKQPSLLNIILDNEDAHKNAVISEYGLSKGLPTIDLLDLFPEWNESVNPFSFLDGSSLMDIALLKAFAKKYTNCNYFEIGTWRGESVANVASIAQKCFTLNLSDDEMRKANLPEQYIALHRFYSKKLSNVVHLFGNSQSYDFSALNEKFDLIFVDGSHHFQEVKSDTQNVFKLLRNKDSTILWHDYGNTPYDIRWNVLHGILKGTPPDLRKKLYRVSNTLCAIYTNLPLKSTYPDEFIEPGNNFNINISAKKSN